MDPHKPNQLRNLDTLNGSGRRKRSERLEVCISVSQYLVTKWMDLATRRCTRHSDKNNKALQDHLQAPTAAHLAAMISKSGAWKGTGRLTAERVYLALQDLEDAGYIKRTKQLRTKMASGTWCSHPKIISFTRSFFEDLGGHKLWREIRAKGKQQWEKLQGKWQRLMGDVTAPGDVKMDLATYLNPGLVLSPGQAYQYRQQAPPGTGTFFREITFSRA